LECHLWGGRRRLMHDQLHAAADALCATIAADGMVWRLLWSAHGERLGGLSSLIDASGLCIHKLTFSQ
jgi:hypothetical protein